MIHQWPIWATSSRKEDRDQCVSTTMKSALECRPLLNCLVYSALYYQCYFSGREPSTESFLLRSHQDTVTSLKEELTRTKDNVSEANLLTIAVLATHGSVSTTTRKRVISTEPNVRENYFFSSIDWDPVHVHALLSLTAIKGGLLRLKNLSLLNMIFT
jgi:hypothetical protein